MRIKLLIIGLVLAGVWVAASVFRPGVGQSFKVQLGGPAASPAAKARGLKATASEALAQQLAQLDQKDTTADLIMGNEASKADPAIGGDATDAGLELLIAQAPLLNNDQKQGVVTYLTAAAKVDMPTPELITFAIIRARDGDAGELQALAPRVRAAADALGNLNPPAALAAYHGASILNLKNYADALSSVAQDAGNTAQMLTALNSAPYNAVRQEARELIKTLRALILKNDIIVGSEVLPNTALP